MKSNISQLSAVMAVNGHWEQIGDRYHHIMRWLDLLVARVNAALGEAYDSQWTSLRDDAVEVLAHNLSHFDISRETIQKYFDKHITEEGDPEEFLETLRIIAHAKINAHLPKEFNLDAANGEHLFQKKLKA